MNWEAVAGELQVKAWTEDKGPEVMEVFTQHNSPFELLKAVHD